MTFSEMKRAQLRRTRSALFMWAILWAAVGLVAGVITAHTYRDREETKRHKIECELNALYGFKLYEGCKR